MTDNTLMNVIDRCKCHLKGRLFVSGGVLKYVHGGGQRKDVWDDYLADRQILMSFCPDIIVEVRLESDSISAALITTQF